MENTVNIVGELVAVGSLSGVVAGKILATYEGMVQRAIKTGKRYGKAYEQRAIARTEQFCKTFIWQEVGKQQRVDIELSRTIGW